MKITIKIDAKEVADLIRELEGQKPGITKVEYVPQRQMFESMVGESKVSMAADEIKIMAHHLDKELGKIAADTVRSKSHQKPPGAMW